MFKVLRALALEISCHFSLNPEERSLGKLIFQIYQPIIEIIILFTNICF